MWVWSRFAHDTKIRIIKYPWQREVRSLFYLSLEAINGDHQRGYPVVTCTGGCIREDVERGSQKVSIIAVMFCK
jgi:hypothetical protein